MTSKIQQGLNNFRHTLFYFKLYSANNNGLKISCSKGVCGVSAATAPATAVSSIRLLVAEGVLDLLLDADLVNVSVLPVGFPVDGCRRLVITSRYGNSLEP
jgi:hypothetical protein